MFGMQVDIDRFLGMRLSEHAVHSWDVRVVRDQSATILPDAVGLLIDQLGSSMSRLGSPSSAPQFVDVRTTDPERHFQLDTAGVRLTPADSADAAPDWSVELPAERFVRLVYGRLTEQETADAALARLTAVFQGI